jgi:predicted negative regulator of RcsB-dependent stress response
MSADLKESPVPLAEISQGPNAFDAFLDRNQKGIVVFAILLALGGAATVVYRGIESSRQNTAGAELTKAKDLTGYQAVIDGNPKTIAAASAMVLLADSQWTAGKKDDAISSLKNFIATYPEHPALASAKASLASKLMAQGKTGDASKIFEDLVTDPAARYIAPFALISLGDMAKAAGNLENAEASYTKAKNEFPDSSFSDTANRRIAILKTKPPVEIDPPPAPPAPPVDPTAAIKAALPPGITVTPSTPPETPPSSGPSELERTIELPPTPKP